MTGARRKWCIGEREVGRLGDVTFYERVLRTERRRGDSDRGDQAIYFGLRAGARAGPWVDGHVLWLALAGRGDFAVDAVTRAVAEFYRTAGEF